MSLLVLLLLDGKDFSDVVESQLASYGGEWQVSNCDAQDSIYNPDKAKAEFAKAKRLYKRREFNSQLI